MEAKKLKGLIKFFMLIVTLTILLSCSKEPSPIFENCEIDLLVEEDASFIPSRYSHYVFYCKGSNGNIVELKHKELIEVYKKQFYNFDYHDFLFQLLNQKISIDIEDRYYFKLNNGVSDKFESNDFDTFLDYFVRGDVNERNWLKESLSQSELDTFSYLLFVNGYFVRFDDQIGFYFITCKSDVFHCL